MRTGRARNNDGAGEGNAMATAQARPKAMS